MPVSRDTLFVSGSDLFALGHYPGNPVYPGALMLDRMLAMAADLAGTTLGQAVHVSAVQRVQYLGVVVPGDMVALEVTIQTRDGDTLTCEAIASVAGDARVRATIVCRSGVVDATAPAVQAVGTSAPALTHQQIARLLPHRYPFLLLDTVTTYRPGEHILATKVVNRESPILGRQPPAAYPATLAIESFGQAGVTLFYLGQTGDGPTHALVGLMRDVTLHRPIPYDTVLTLNVRIDRLRSNMVVFGGHILIGDEPAIDVGSLVVMIAPASSASSAGA
ncbi:3-hydroxyacyl-ACP dehydratase FabZ family protein [Cupriavidus pauculus]|uniref:Beta-hydroxyacyl-ACP dehydratase n=1 Tax=Cupriavidus pauculus TaxID=82633 RepID=A0A2N5CFP9_9BURK|nr:beta-hydroxyacyl-ACP dehydratase [Cupriavidus pauculus]PLQ01066.1 beta-hydroxyacyl-ACP dehydratase [Cupriavidus pauculus]